MDERREKGKLKFALETLRRTAISKQLKASLVRILEANRDVATGAGFLVSPKHVITCAHVVANELGLPSATREMPTADVHLDFPLPAPGRKIMAKVICWHSIGPDPAALSENGEDIAVLEIEETLPGSAEPARPLIIADNVQGHAFFAYGFPGGGVTVFGSTANYKERWPRGQHIET